jgi:Rrf2 family transcriptional repressor of oqxAB
MLTLAAAYESKERLTSATLAGGVKVHPALVRRLLIPLAAAGLVETFKGKVGGARLGRSPKQINLREIFEAAVDSELVCGPKRFNGACKVGSCMNKVFAGVVEGMESASLKFLESIPLEKLLVQVKG